MEDDFASFEERFIPFLSCNLDSRAVETALRLDEEFSSASCVTELLPFPFSFFLIFPAFIEEVDTLVSFAKPSSTLIPGAQ